jgi:indolepyruvate ferredoxin oxidoreductase beta subunit
MPSDLKIQIRQSWCKGCEFCVAICTHDVFRMDGAKPIVEKLDRCTGCELCVWICPDFAIKITKDASSSSSFGERSESQTCRR